MSKNYPCNREDFSRPGRRCLRLLVARIESSEHGMSVKVTPELVVGPAPPPGGADAPPGW
jgi:hypothetical protein